MKVNMNDFVRVKLTERGRKILAYNAEQLRQRFPGLPVYTPPAVDADGYSSFQLWSLMQDFGPHIAVGLPEQPFETDMIFADCVEETA